MTLKKHFSNACRAAEITVDLKNTIRVYIKEVWECKTGKQLPQVRSGSFALAQAGPQVDHIGPAPARMTAAVGHTLLEGAADGGGQFGVGPGAYHIAGMKGVKVGHVAVAWLPLLIVLDPFLESTGTFADFVGSKLRKSRFQISTETGVRLHFKNINCSYTVGEDFPGDHQVNRRSITQVSNLAIRHDEVVLG